MKRSYPITDFVNYQNIKKSKYFEDPGTSMFTTQYVSKTTPRILIQKSNITIRGDIYIINNSNVSISISHNENKSTTIRYSYSGKPTGTIRVIIPSNSNMNNSSRNVGIQINFDLNDPKQYKLFKELMKLSRGINQYGSRKPDRKIVR